MKNVFICIMNLVLIIKQTITLQVTDLATSAVACFILQ